MGSGCSVDNRDEGRNIIERAYKIVLACPCSSAECLCVRLALQHNEWSRGCFALPGTAEHVDSETQLDGNASEEARRLERLTSPAGSREGNAACAVQSRYGTFLR